ncbi:MAG: murein L,D-transpeptidase catalytic domain family protein, partial [Bacteroidetes bacterium]|nr:murein L,D-transpeptidase catalytic domain family protein [Bacteroidota bacterium]
MNRNIFIKISSIFLLALISIVFNKPTQAITEHEPENLIISMEEKARIVFDSLSIEGLEFEVFLKAYNGYNKLLNNGKIQNRILSIIDFSKSSNTERLYVIDMEKNAINYKSLVAHGKMSGNEYADSFSNILNSGKSSIGFYVTAETYSGKHGYSLRLDGMEDSNSEARSRAKVVHRAEY